MGNLNHLKIERFIEEYGANVFFETGTHEGNALRVAQQCKFESLYSVEIVRSQAQKMQQFFANDKRITVLWDNSLSAFKKILPTIESNIVFWLDAHFPGADLGLAPYASDLSNAYRLPLEQELACIKELRRGKRDVILMDDIKIYRNNGRDMNRQECKPNEPFSSDNFFREILADTHDAEIIEEHEVYCILTPKK